MTECTLSMIKPEAVAAGHVGPILQALQALGTMRALKAVHLSPDQGAQFYAVHHARPFFPELVAHISSGPVVVSIWEGPEIVQRYRTLMGATDPAAADPATLRARFGQSIGMNAVHGSDSVENAQIEMALFFSQLEWVRVG